MKLTPDMPIHQRVQIIRDALAKVLNRGPEMSVESSGPSWNDLAVWVVENPWSDNRVGHDLDEIARELEALLS